MVDPHEGFIPSKRQGFGCRESYDERTGQSWESRNSDGAERIGLDSGLFERRVEHRQDPLKVCTSGDLGDHAGKLLMQQFLSRYALGEHASMGIDQSCCGFIAGRFDR